MQTETSLRSALKSISWRIGGSLTTCAVVYVFTRSVSLSLGVGGLDMFLKMAAYYVHERLWSKIRFGLRETLPAVIWLTGLPGSGKSTVADAVVQRLAKQGYKVERLDGDTVRTLFPSTGFTREARNEHIKRVGYLASKLEQHGVFVVASFISPYAESRAFVRDLCKGYVEVYVSTPLAVCEKRDPKGLYAKARKGEIKNFTGIDDPYEIPEKPEIVIDTDLMSAEQAAEQIVRHVEGLERKRRGLFS